MDDHATRTTDPRVEQELEHLRRLAYLLDDAFRLPLVNHRFGIDAVMGLVPGIGDVGGFVLSAYLVARARRLGVPNRLLARMAARSALDLAVGSLPVVGDVADFVLKPNRRAIRTLERYLEERLRQAEAEGRRREAAEAPPG